MGLNVKAIVASFNQEKALVGAFSVIVQTASSMDQNTALPSTALLHLIESIVSAEYLICGTGPSVLRNMASLLCRVHTKPPGFKIVQQLHHTLLIINTSLVE